MLDEIIQFFSDFFSRTDFPARWYCGRWTYFHGYLYIFSNFMIAAAYFAIPGVLARLIRHRKDLPFQDIFWLFVAFILFCGSTHMMDGIIFWFPLYRWNAVLLFFTAVVSWVTAYKLFKVMPSLMELKTTEQLQDIILQKTSELEIANRRLLESERQFRALVDQHPDIIVRIDRSGKIRFINPAIRNINGHKKNKYLNRYIHEFRELEMRDYDLIGELKKVFEQKELSYFEASLRNTERYYAVSIVPLYDESKSKVDDALLILRDITFQKKAEKEIQENLDNLHNLSQTLSKKNHKLENFAHIISHNLRSPAGNITQLVGLLSEENDPAERDIFMQSLKEVSDRIMETLQDLMDLIQAPQHESEQKEELWFEDILKAQMANIALDIEEAQAIIDFDFSACPQIHYPRVYLESIVLNLLTNAIKYRSPLRQARIQFKSWMEDERICLSCRDNGLGINLKKYKNKIFGLKQTFHGNKNAKGLGLFMTKNQIEAMGGSIDVESEVGQGTTFKIVFNEIIPELPKLNRLWIMDDDEIYRFHLRKNLKKHHLIHHIEVFSNGKIGWDKLMKYKNHPQYLPDLILLDMDMPVMDGFQFLAQLELFKEKISKNIHIYVSSAFLAEEDYSTLQKSNLISGFLPKPVRKEDLIEVIKRITLEAVSRQV